MNRSEPDESDPRPARRPRWLRRRPCWVPTWQGWTAILLAGGIAIFAFMHTIHGFLAITAPVPATTLVIEGWAPDYAAEKAIAEFHQGHYSLVCVTGGPMERGEPLSEYGTYAELGAALLAKLGMPTNHLYAVPAPKVRKDRTYKSALVLKKWLANHGGVPGALNVISVGPHARRTRLLYECAFGDHTRIGIIAVDDPNYDARHWWRSSLGVRTVLDESIAYLYARFLFHPHTE